ncbi:MAG: hypothetical protein ACRENL_06815, partial [Candidatus Dormibacteria bacterium]
AAVASGRARRLRAVGRRETVIWDRVDGDTAHGLTSTYLEVVAAASAVTRPGGVARVELDALRGEALHGTVVP